jgi:hypothetical protein
LEAVEKSRYDSPVKLGIGTEEQVRALRSAGCEEVFSLDQLRDYAKEDKLPMRLIFRRIDTVVMVQPGILPVPLMREIAGSGCKWEVPGHDAEPLPSEEKRAAWRRQKPRSGDWIPVPEVQGRPPKWPVPTQEQINVIVGWWHSDRKPADILPDAQRLVGAEVPMHWVRDQVIKATGSAKRNP